MTRGDDLRLADIREACQTAVGLVKRGRTTFDSDFAVPLALERLLEIIGEAAGALTEDARQAYPNAPWREMMHLRVLLAHHYHRVDPGQVWAIAERDVPALLAALSPVEEGRTDGGA